MVELDRAALIRLNLGAQAVNDAIRDALAGAEVGFIPHGPARHAIVIRMPDSLRADPAAILALPLRVGDYGMVPLSRVARLKETRIVEPILHDDTNRRAALMVNLSTSDLAGYVQRAQAAIDGQVKLPPGYRIEFGGQYHQLEAAQKRLSIVVPAALMLIFALVYAALGSVREAAIVYTGIPFAVTGGVLALWLRGMPFSITAAIGFIALSGIAMLNGLVLIDHINALRDGREGDPLPAEDAVRRGAHDRCAPSCRPHWWRRSASSHGDRDRLRRRGAATARHRRHRRDHNLDDPDPGAPAQPLRLDRTPPTHNVPRRGTGLSENTSSAIDEQHLAHHTARRGTAV